MFQKEYTPFFQPQDHVFWLRCWVHQRHLQILLHPQHLIWKKKMKLLVFLFCNRGDTIQYQGGLRSRELCQAPMLLVFLTPRQALSSHPHQCFWASLKLLFFMIFVGVHEFSSKNCI